MKNICDILVDIFGFHSFRLANMAGVGRRFGGTVYRERRIANGSDLVVRLGVDCSREMDISLQNS